MSMADSDLRERMLAITHVDPFEKADYNAFVKRFSRGGSVPTETAWLKHENTRLLRTIGKLDYEIKQLRDVLDVATMEVVKLQAENADLKRRLSRKWNGVTNPFRCPTCGRFVKLEAASFDLAGRLLYVQCWCKSCNWAVTPAPGYSTDDVLRMRR